MQIVSLKSRKKTRQKKAKTRRNNKFVSPGKIACSCLPEETIVDKDEKKRDTESKIDNDDDAQDGHDKMDNFQLSTFGWWGNFVLKMSKRCLVYCP